MFVPGLVGGRKERVVRPICTCITDRDLSFSSSHSELQSRASADYCYFTVSYQDVDGTNRMRRPQHAASHIYPCTLTDLAPLAVPMGETMKNRTVISS